MKIISMTIITLLLFACNNKKQADPSHDMANMKMDSTPIQKVAMGNMANMSNDSNTNSMENMPNMGNDSSKDTMKNMPNMGNNSSTDTLKLSEQQIQLGNIQTDIIDNRMMGDKIILTATLNIDQKKTTSISARVMGRIEKLYFKNVGDYVKKGDKLYDLYSEELNNAKQELILLLERKNTLDNLLIDFNRLIESAKYKLLLWGMSEAQIEALATTKTPSPLTTFYSPASGFISLIEQTEGGYTMEGSTVVRLADLSTLWAEAQVYAAQLSQIDKNGIVEVQILDMPNKIIKGKIEFTNPEINPDTRINLVRVTIPNPNNQLKPGMSAYVFFKSPLHNMISLPIDAVIRDGKGATVWLQTGNKTFQNRMVVTGMETGERIEIKSGLKTGDVVVVTGAYLINSEYIFRKGANPMEGMNMSKK